MAQLVKTFYPYDPLAAAELNQIVSFLNGTAAGTNIEDEAILHRHLAPNSVESGNVDGATFPKFKARRAAALNFPRASTSIFAVDTIEHNIGGGTISGGRYTVPISGVYRITASFTVLDNPVTGWLVVYKNGSLYANLNFQSGGYYPTMSGSTSIELAVGDIVDVRFLNEQTTRDPIIATDTSSPTHGKINQLCIEYIP